MYIENLITLCLVLETGSFSAAARRLDLAQPAVSQRIKSAEQELGVQLIDRSRVPVTLTAEGEQLIDSVHTLLLHYRSLKERAQQMSERGPKHFRVASGVGAGEFLMPHLLSSYRQGNRDTRASLSVGSPHEIVRMLLSGTVDIGILNQFSLTHSRKLKAEAFGRERFHLVVRPDHVWASPGEISLEDLRGAPLILREKGAASRQTIDHALTHSGLLHEVHVVIELGTNAAIKRAVQSGIGAAFLSEFAVMEELAEGSLVFVNVAGLSIDHTLHAAYVKDGLQPAARGFLRYLRELGAAEGIRS